MPHSAGPRREPSPTALPVTQGPPAEAKRTPDPNVARPGRPAPPGGTAVRLHSLDPRVSRGPAWGARTTCRVTDVAGCVWTRVADGARRGAFPGERRGRARDFRLDVRTWSRAEDGFVPPTCLSVIGKCICLLQTKEYNYTGFVAFKGGSMNLRFFVHVSHYRIRQDSLLHEKPPRIHLFTPPSPPLRPRQFHSL